MDWYQHVDGYCERLDPGFWAEPINAVTNVAFLIAALIMAIRVRGTRLPLAHALTILLALIGIGSFLFHTYATPWAGVIDVVPIVLFALTYLYAASRSFLGLTPLWSALTIPAFLAFTALTLPLFSQLPLYGASAS